MFPILSTSESQIIFKLRPGKPDHEKEDGHFKLQSAQKGPTCWYYALNMIRDRIGKDPKEGFEEKRAFEQLSSKRRKEITALRKSFEETHDVVQQLLHDARYAKHNLRLKANCLTMLPRLQAAMSHHDEEVVRETTLVFNILKAFCDDGGVDDLEEFYQQNMIKQVNKVNTVFLQTLGHDPKALYEIDAGQDASIDIELPAWDTLSEIQKRPLLDNFAMRSCIKGYNLTASEWSPAQPIASLIHSLSTHGPMYCKGFSGKMYYHPIAPAQVKTIETTPIFGWKKTDPRNELPIAHSIVVVGAGIEGGLEFVYYVDPLDASDPTAGDSQRPIYVTTYARFIERIINLRNEKIDDKSSPKAGLTPWGLHHS